MGPNLRLLTSLVEDRRKEAAWDDQEKTRWMIRNTNVKAGWGLMCVNVYEIYYMSDYVCI